MFEFFENFLTKVGLEYKGYEIITIVSILTSLLCFIIFSYGIFEKYSIKVKKILLKLCIVMLCFDLLFGLKMGYAQIQYKNANYTFTGILQNTIFKDKEEVEQVNEGKEQDNYKELKEITQKADFDLENHDLLLCFSTIDISYGSKIQYRVENHKAYFRVIKNKSSDISLRQVAIAIDKEHNVTDWEFFSSDDENASILTILVSIILKGIFVLFLNRKINKEQNVPSK